MIDQEIADIIFEEIKKFWLNRRPDLTFFQVINCLKDYLYPMEDTFKISDEDLIKKLRDRYGE